MRARLIKDFRFEAAHQLLSAPEDHKCSRIHGHSFRVEIAVEGEVDPQRGWIYDHAEISKAVDPLIQQLDHSFLNEIPGLETPTIEVLAAWFWKRLKSLLPGLVEITVHETARVRCVYRGE